jgi:hypothetical protein
MDIEPKNNKSPVGCLSGTAGIITAIAALVTAITGFMIAFHSPGGDSDATTFSARSYCSRRNVTGYGKGDNARAARSMAIGECVSNGGDPECCEKVVSVSQD